MLHYKQLQKFQNQQTQLGTSRVCLRTQLGTSHVCLMWPSIDVTEAEFDIVPLCMFESLCTP